MGLKRKRLVVGMLAADEHGIPEDEYVVDMLLGDQLRAELELKKRGMGKPSDAAVHFQSAIAWAAMVRQWGFAGDFKQFGQVAAYVDDHKEDDPADEVDPTNPAASSDSA